MASPTPRIERRFYSEDRAIGRFGMRLFPPSLMPAPHWHGHIEANYLTGTSMTYVIEDHRIEVPPNRMVIFWANIPHQLVALTPTGEATPRLANIYLPLDRFLFMTHIATLQVALLSGGMVALDPGLVGLAQVEAWYRDYRSGHAERREIMLLELSALLRRAQLSELDYLHRPGADPQGARTLQSGARRHVVAMVRHILENLSEPLTNADVAAVSGLHENYALSLFTGAMGVPMRRFIIRMRLLRARALLLESSASVSAVALQSGFASPSQFYDHFRRAYGVTPQALRREEARGSGSGRGDRD